MLHSWYWDNENTIQRFVVDECHQAITSDDYRKKFSSVKELAQYLLQKIFLTATLPPYLEEFYLQQVCLPASTVIIRAPTNRKHLRYHVLNVNQWAWKLNDVAIDLARLVEKEVWTATSCGIIVCLSCADVDTLSQFFGKTKSHSYMEASDHVELQEKWCQGLANHRWMVATTGFIHGIDQTNVDTVIFLDMPYGLTNFVQGAG